MRRTRLLRTLLAIPALTLALTAMRPVGPAPDTAAATPDTTAAADTTAAPVRVMPLGDSITGSPGCWRAVLWNKLQSTGYTSVDFVGTLGPQGCGFGHNHSDGNPDEDAIMATAQSLGLGYLGWSWSGNSGGVEYLDMATNFDPAALTSWGQRIFKGANGIAATAKEATVYR